MYVKYVVKIHHVQFLLKCATNKVGQIHGLSNKLIYVNAKYNFFI